MKRITITIAVTSACVILSAAAQATPAYQQLDAGARKQISGLTIPFVANAGQWDPSIAFSAQTFAGSLAVGKDGRLAYHLPAGDGGTSSTTLTETFVDRRGRAVVSVPSGASAQTTQVSYMLGRDPAKHRSGLATYGHVALGEVYPGIDVRLRATGTNVEKIFTVAPGVDAGAIKIRLGGAQRMEIGSAGELVAHTVNGPVAYTPPVAFQHDGQGARSTVPVRYALAGGEYGFVVGAYDRTQPLVIDPLLQSTYLGGSTGRDGIFAMVLHPTSGELIVAGRTQSTDFPCTTATAGGICVNGPQTQHASGSNYDAFVARVSGDLTTLLQATYFGGSGNDVINAIAVLPIYGQTQIIVAGDTDSADLPCHGEDGGGCASPYAGAGDGFVARFSSDLSILFLARYFGGHGLDSARALAVNAAGDIYVAGASTSTDLPCTVFLAGTGCQNGAQSIAPAQSGGFVARFSSDLINLVQTTYGQIANAMVILPATGDLITGGHTTTASLPCTKAGIPAGCLDGAQSVHGGGNDGFLARYSATLLTLKQATYFGGSAGSDDQINALAIHPLNGDLYVGGSTKGALPCTANPCGVGAQSVYGGDPSDGFVARLNPSLTVPIYQATYLGGSNLDTVLGLAIHPVSGEVYPVGWTISQNFPCVSASMNGCGDGPLSAIPVDAPVGYVARLSPDLRKLAQASFTSDHSGAGSVTPTGNAARAVVFRASATEVVVAGETGYAICSTPDPACGAGGARPTFNTTGTTDAFIERFSADLTAGDTSPSPFAFVPQVAVPVSTSRTSNPVLISGINAQANIYLEGQAGSTYCVSTGNNCGCNVTNNMFIATPGFVQPGNYVCVRHTSSSTFPVLTRTSVHIGTGFANFDVTTGPTALCSLDVDGDNKIDPLTDGLLLMRAMFGLTGDAVTAGAVGAGAERSLWSQIRQYLNDYCGTILAP